VQSTFKINSDEDIVAHKLSNSPSTGTVISAVTNEVMEELMKPICKGYTTEIIGKAYDTDVKIPFWFKHFGEGHNGAGDAYHIGVFGKTGSGKTTTAAHMLAGYAGNSEAMSFLIFDPQEQFYNDNKVIPNGKFKDLVLKNGIKPGNYKPIVIPDDLALPDSSSLFAELMLTSGFIRHLFNLKTDEKLQLMTESIEDYIEGRYNNPGFSLNRINPDVLLNELIQRFATPQGQAEVTEGCSKYISIVYAKGAYRNSLIARINDINDALQNNRADYKSQIAIFREVLDLFHSKSNESIDKMVDDVLTKPGFMYIVNLAPRANKNFRNENFQAKLIEVILSKVIDKAAQLATV
jgi:hypothetical protein